jgi:hypothetical protein
MTSVQRPSGALAESDPLYAPLIKWRPRKSGEVAYWIAPIPDVRKGFAPKSVAIDPSLSHLEIAQRCRQLWADLEVWRVALGKKEPTRFTISWLVDRYLNDKFSPFYSLGYSSRKSYEHYCKIIAKTVGNRRFDPVLEGGRPTSRINGMDVRRWHEQWGRPNEAGEPQSPSRARHVVIMLRVLFSYAIELGAPGGRDTRQLLSVMRFPLTAAREIAPTRDQVLSIVKTAIAMNQRSIALTTLAQFEFTERRVHIIGSWEGKQWRPGWLWSGVSKDWVITYYQTKRGRVERSYDFRDTPALLELLQQTPENSRVGPIVICETTGQPWHYREYASMFRKIARAAGISDEIWSMDMRAGGATEAGNIHGVSSFDIQAAGGWTDAKMASRYTRDRVNRAQNVVRLRQRARTTTNGERN